MRYASVVVLLALVFSGCAIGVSSPPTGVGQTTATLHGNVFSSLNGPTEAWFIYGQGTNTANWSETQHQTVDVSTRNAYPVSASLTGLTAGTSYNWQLCVRDQQLQPPYKVCSATQSFTTDAASPTRYIAMGDSLTQVGSATDERYPERFFSYLDGAGAADELSNIGISGERSNTMISGSQLTTAKQEINDPDTDTSVLTIDIGGNDLLQESSCLPTSPGFSINVCQTTISTFATNLETIFDELDTALGNDPGSEQVIAIEYYNPWSGRPNSTTPAANARLALLGTDDTIDCDGTGTELGFNDVIACTAQDHGYKVADLIPPFNGHGTIGDYFFDDIHPNDAGHQVVADTLEDVFEAP